MEKPNILFILTDQLRAASLPLFGEKQIETPNIDRLAGEGVNFTNAISTCPICTPYRSMLLTGRHPQTTGHIFNFTRTRYDEIGFGDVFANAGYATGWVGKWHLHTGSFPQVSGQDFVPEGRDRLGFEYWRGYNFHMQYFNGGVNVGDWRCEQWKGYETDALNRYAIEFIDQVEDKPFCLFISPHQPHYTPGKFAPDKYYGRLPGKLTLPDNVPESVLVVSLEMYRHYLAMILALDDMVGELLDYLEDTGRDKNTLVIFTSDHGTQGGAKGIPPWKKKMPYEESLKVPLIMRWPGVFDGGITRDTLTAPVDFLPSLCSLCGISIPRTVEGFDLSKSWQGKTDAFEQDAILTMNFTAEYNYLIDGEEWRGVRTKKYNYSRWLNGKTELFDIQNDPFQTRNLVDEREMKEVRDKLEKKMQELMAKRNDELIPGSEYKNWFDNYRRVIRNAYGLLGDPEDSPDWSLLTR